MKIFRNILALAALVALFAIAVPRGYEAAGLVGAVTAFIIVNAFGFLAVDPRKALDGRARLTLSVSEILDDLIVSFTTEFPILTKMGLDLRGTTLKKGKAEIAHITTLPTTSTFNAASGGYGYGAQSARALLADVSVTPDQHPTCPLYWEHIDQISDDKNKYSEAIRLTGYVLVKGVIDNILAGVTTRNFSKEVVIAVADMDYDGVAAVTTQANRQQMLPIGRVMIVSSAVAEVLDRDSRITSKDYSGQQTGGKGIRAFKNVGGFELIQEYPDMPTNNGTALTGVTIAAAGDLATKAAHGLATGDPIIFSSLTGGAGLSTNTRYWAIVASASTFKIASTYALAVAGTGIDITTNYTDATVTLSENLIAFAFDKRAICVLAGIPDGFDSELMSQLNIPQVMGMVPTTEEQSGMTMAGVSWQEVGTGKLLFTPTFIWGKGLGRQAAAASTANVGTDYAGLRVVSS